MKIRHRIFNNWNKQQITTLEEFGIKINEGPDSFEIEENDSYYLLMPLLQKWDAMDNVGTQFNKKEKQEANYAQIYASWLNDYPQPEDNYLEASYDLSNYCNECGIGRVQKAPLRIKKEPKWGRKKTFGLNWIFDVLFVKKEWYELVFRPMGINSKPVMLHRKDVVAESVVQLDIPEITTNLNLEDYPIEVCSICSRTKYIPITKGFFPSLMANVNLPVFKSVEYVGSGGSANKWLLINKDLKDELLINKFNLNIYPLK